MLIDVVRGRLRVQFLGGFRHHVGLLYGSGFRLGSGLIQAEIGWLESDVEEVLSPGEMEGTGFGGEAGALLHEVGNIVRGERLVDQGVFHSSPHGLRGVDVAQGHDFPHVVVRIESTFFELTVIGLGLRRERQKTPEHLVIPRFFALFQQRFGVIGVFKVLEAIVTPAMARNERLTVVEAESVGIRFQRERVASPVGRDRVAIGLQGHTKLPGGADLGHGGDIEGMGGQRAEMRALLVPQIGRLAGGFRHAGGHWQRCRASAWLPDSGRESPRSRAPPRSFF